MQFVPVETREESMVLEAVDAVLAHASRRRAEQLLDQVLRK
jgi:hypothetical protein